MGKTLFDKIWEQHVVGSVPGGQDIIYIDRHLIHEVTSPQAFALLDEKSLELRHPEKTFAVCDHNTPTVDQDRPVRDPASANALDALARNTARHGIRYYPLGDPGNGIVHVVGPQQGIVLCGQTVVCGDSHTSTHGAFGNIAFGIGTSEVAMVFASQCLVQAKPRQTLIRVDGTLGENVCPKDVILYIISKLGTSGCNGTFVEYAGSTFSQMSMEGRMTVCNMSIEMGARGGLVAPDETTFEYIRGREHAPKGEELDRCVEQWRSLCTDTDAVYDYEYHFDAADIRPMVTYGTNPGMGVAVDGEIPSSAVGCDTENFAKALSYMGFETGEKMIGKKIDYVFLGSCTNGRIEDFRAFASAVKGRKKAAGVTAWLVPGSKEVERLIEAEGLGAILRAAGFDIRQPGCSACLAMNADKIPAGCYCVSTSNRNFEGRQGTGARTILAGPIVAAEAAVNGFIAYPAKQAAPEQKAAREKFTTLTSTAVVLPVNNIDTDQIIPARFLKTTSRAMFAENLFYDCRQDPSFALNHSKGKILVAGRNFGCGSSREHAAWALYDYGFRAVISSSFADIFRNNALNNGLLPVTVSEEFLAALFNAAKADPDLQVTVDLTCCECSAPGVGRCSFDINPYKRECMLNAYDDIDYLISNISKIEDYEAK